MEITNFRKVLRYRSKALVGTNLFQVGLSQPFRILHVILIGTSEHFYSVVSDDLLINNWSVFSSSFAFHGEPIRPDVVTIAKVDFDD